MPHRTDVDRTQIPRAALDLCTRLSARGHGAWIVGGCVRDHLLGRPVADWDLCTTARPDELLRIFPRAIPTGIEHGTVTVVVDKVPYEVTTLRGETTYTDGRRPDAVFFVEDVTHDLARRDFTVNAIAYDPERDALIDPFGGLDDLDARVLRAVGDPTQRFSEDGLRVLRAVRFVATLEFDLDEATFAAIGPNLGTFRKVSAERVRDEWIKTMKARHPSRAFELMRVSGILSVTCPALLEGVGVPPHPGAAGDVWEHTMRALDVLPPGDPVLRVAALLHDLALPRALERGDRAAHGELGAALADEFLKALRFSNDERARVAHLVRHHAVAYRDEASDGEVRRLVQRLGAASLPDLFAFWTADATGRREPDAAALARLARLRARIDALLAAGAVLSTRELAINGNDLQKELGIPPSRRVGQVLTALLERVLDDPSENTRERLLAAARAIVAESAG